MLVLREGGPQPDSEHRLRVLDALDGSTRAEEVLAPASYATSALAPPAEHDEEAARAGMARLFPA
jgi:hypothetical protein